MIKKEEKMTKIMIKKNKKKITLIIVKYKNWRPNAGSINKERKDQH